MRRESGIFRAGLLVPLWPLDSERLDRGLSGPVPRKRLLNGDEHMRILLYNPDNGVTRNFMPHLWMFLLQSLTPEGHEVVLIDGNAQPMDEAGIARFVLEQNIGLVGIGAMTRMIAKAYRVADAIRAVGVPVVMGGPHVTEEADEALGRNGGPRAASSRTSTLLWIRLARKANPVSRNIRRFPGTKSISTSLISFQKWQLARSSVSVR